MSNDEKFEMMYTKVYGTLPDYYIFKVLGNTYEVVFRYEVIKDGTKEDLMFAYLTKDWSDS